MKKTVTSRWVVAFGEKSQSQGWILPRPAWVASLRAGSRVGCRATDHVTMTHPRPRRVRLRIRAGRVGRWCTRVGSRFPRENTSQSILTC